MAYIAEGLNLSNIDDTKPEEVDQYLLYVLRSARKRGLTYWLTAETVMFDHRPDFGKIQRMGADVFGRGSAERVLVQSIRVLPLYIQIGWETGIYNEFRQLQESGLTKAQLMEIVMFAQISGGIRALQHVYNAVGRHLPDFRDGPQPAPFPAGWAADPDAFECGLDLSTAQLTAQDRANLTSWYEGTIGYVPPAVTFAIAHRPAFLKVERAKWEACFQTLPKQVAPYIMLAQNTLRGFQDGIREAALLGKAWGLTPEWIVESVTGTAYYFTGLDGLAAAERALGSLLQEWH